MKFLLSKSQITLGVIAALLLAIWPLPGTIALRHCLLLFGFLLSIYVFWIHRKMILSIKTWPLHVLMFFFIWLLAHYFFLATNHQEQLKELRGDWLRTFLAAIIGGALGVSIRTTETDTKTAKKLKIILILGFAGTVLIFFFRYLYEIYSTGNWFHENFFMTPYKSKPALVIFGILLIPHSYLHIFLAVQKERGGALLYTAITGIFLIMFAFYFGNTKNGFLLLLLTSILFFISLWSIRNDVPKNPLSLLFLIALIGLFSVPIRNHIQSNSAWKMMLADAKVAIDINEHPHWKNRKIYPIPLNEYGVPVNGSTYERLSWATAGIQLIKEYPLGYGLIHHSFGALAARKWSDFEKNERETRGATHSGWIDFTLGLGIPGLLLIVIPLCVSLYRSRNRNDYWHNYIRWAIPILFVAYTLTEVSSDHFIELLFFLTAMFCGITTTTTIHRASKDRLNRS